MALKASIRLPSKQKAAKILRTWVSDIVEDIARAIAMQPEILLMDEPCSALDPIATRHIEDLVDQLKTQYTVVLVTHNMQQAARVSDRTAFMLTGELVEVTSTNVLFTNPTDSRTQDYITGRFG